MFKTRLMSGIVLVTAGTCYLSVHGRLSAGDVLDRNLTDRYCLNCTGYAVSMRDKRAPGIAGYLAAIVILLSLVVDYLPDSMMLCCWH
ncbi:MAG: hypothetical protein ACLSHW_07200 [Lachnospiraceae bacterium]